MRTLLIDNYDSFTFNLFHHLAQVNGVEPEVIRNDDPAWRPQMLDDFDNVVLSPGPGRPDRPADFGICAEIVEKGQLPLLGVCLGHQGIAAVHGGAVGRAPEPRHGRTSAVRHGGTGLFEGLPSPLEAVRYHSLAVTDLSPSLQGLAWAPDGVVMALRHRDLPLWGMQFHPESIGTETGHRLLANFRRLSERHHARNARIARQARHAGPRPTTAPASAPAPTSALTGRSAPKRRLRVLAERISTRWDAEVAFDRVFRGGDHPFWLDSGVAGGRLGEISIMGNASGPLARVAAADVYRGTLTVAGRNGSVVVAESFLDWLDRDLRSHQVDVPDLPFEFALGWVGCLGYELKAEADGDRRHRSTMPDAVMVFADRAIVFDHRTDSTYLLALAEDEDDGVARTWLRATERTLNRAAGLAPKPCAAPDPTSSRRLRLRHDRAAYLGLIRTCQDEIRAGETYEVCLTNMIEADTDLDPWHAFRFLRRSSPAPFAAFLSFGDLAVLSTSPERFLRIDRNGVMESTPIKGTRPRGDTDQEDALLVADLATSEKDHAENLMIVDLVRHDLGRCAVVGSVTADPIFQVETYSSVHQLVSTVRARLRDSCSAVAAVRAAFPGGSMTGAPKIRTMRIIDGLEGGARGIYSGAIGYFSLSGAADLSIVIRTLVMTGGRLSYGIGGAIIALSDPEAEFEETAVKATPLLMLLGAEFPERHAVPMLSSTTR